MVCGACKKAYACAVTRGKERLTMTRPPLIGLTTNKVPYSAEDQDVVYFLNITYVESIVQAGGVPLLLPYEFDAWDVLDGALICGGHDLMPSLGGYEAEPGAFAEFRAARDTAELALLRECFARGLPVLGVCRGCQLINCAFGGTLVPDIPAAGFAENHRIQPFTKEGTHPVAATPGSLTERLLNGRTGVCSSHHQAVRTPGKGFSVTARSPEGVIEAIEHESGRILGLQTHPERMEWPEPFEWLIGLAKEHAERN